MEYSKLEEVTKLDDKYIVINKNDVKEAGFSNALNIILEKIEETRAKKGKQVNKSYVVLNLENKSYVVLNLDNDISLAYLNGKLTELIHKRMTSKILDKKIKLKQPTVRDISLILVNAILEAERVNKNCRCK